MLETTVFSNVGILDIPSWLYIQFFMQNPNLQSETSENCRKTNILRNQIASRGRRCIFQISNLKWINFKVLCSTSYPKYLYSHQRNIWKVTFRDQLDRIPQTSKSFEILIPQGRYRAFWLGVRVHASNMLRAEYKTVRNQTNWVMYGLRFQTKFKGL